MAELQKQLAEARAGGQSQGNPELETLRKTAKELEAQLEAVAIERSPKFQQWYKGESDTILNVVKAAVGAHASKVEKILELPPSDYRTAQLDKLLEDLSPSQAAALNVALNDMDKLNYRKSDALTKQKEYWISQHREQEAQAKAQQESQKKAWQKAFDETISEALEHMPAFQKKDGDKSWNDGVEERVALAKRIYNGEDMTPAELAKVAVWASSGSTILEQNRALLKQVDKLTKELEGIRSATPSPQQGGGARLEAAAGSESAGGIDAVLQQAAKLGLVR